MLETGKVIREIFGAIETEVGAKFTAQHTKASVRLPSEWKELNEARTRLHRLGLIGVYPNEIGYGNISLRIDSKNSGSCEFLITGTNTGHLPVLSASDYCLVKDFDIASNTVVTEGLVQASSEAMTHGAVYRNHPEVRCVIHVHSRAIFDKMLKRGYKATPVKAAYGTPELARAVGRCVAEIAAQSEAQSAQPTQPAQPAAQSKTQPEGAIVLAGHEEGVIVYASKVKRALEIVSFLAKDAQT